MAGLADGTNYDSQPLLSSAGAVPAPRIDHYPNYKLWSRIFRDGDPRLHRYRRLVGWLPSPPRCNVCRVPFRGPGGYLMRLRGCTQSQRNSRYCNRCERVIRTRPGATDLELSIVVADVRGSVTFAEKAENLGERAVYVGRLRRFAAAVISVVERMDGFVIDVVGDAIVGVFPPGLSGPYHAVLALRSAQELVRLCPADQVGGLLPFGVGVETGEVYLGNRFSDQDGPADEGLSKVHVLGDHMNIAARLASHAAAGEALISEATVSAGANVPAGAERRVLSLAGHSQPVTVRVLTSF